MPRKRNGPKVWWPQHIAKANAQWDPLAGVGAFSAAWMLEHRALFLTSGVRSAEGRDDDGDKGPGVDTLIQAMLMMDAVEPGKPITLYINSRGGDVHAGMALIQVMRDLRSPIYTFVMQQAASMAAVVAVAGARRYAYPASRWLLHRDFQAAEGDFKDLEIAAREAKLVDKSADQVVLNFTHIKAEELDRMQQKDFWLGARDALRLGLVDDIRVPRQGPPEIRRWLPGQGKGGTISGVEVG